MQLGKEDMAYGRAYSQSHELLDELDLDDTQREMAERGIRAGTQDERCREIGTVCVQEGAEVEARAAPVGSVCATRHALRTSDVDSAKTNLSWALSNLSAMRNSAG